MKQKEGRGKRASAVLTAAYLAVMLSVYLLWPGLGGYRVITAQKWYAYLLFTGLYIAAAVLLRGELALVGAEKLPSPKSVWRAFGPAQKLVLAYLLVTALSALCSPYRRTALLGGPRREGLAAIALYCLSFLLVSAHGVPRRRLFWLFAGALSLNCVCAVIQFAGANPFRLYPEGMNYYDAFVRYSGQFLGTVGNVDILSAVLTLAILGLGAGIVHAKDTRERLLLGVPTALCLFVLFRAFVAGGVVGVAGGTLLSVPVLLKGKKARRIAWIAVACVIVLGLAGVYFLGGRLGGFLYEASELMHGRWNDDFGSGRLYIWRNVLPLVPERPLLGGGPDTLGLRTNASFERYDESLGILIRSSVDAAHNEYLNILVNQGAVALGLYLALLGVSAARWLRRAASEPAAAVCGCAILGYCIQAFFGLSSPISTPYLWLALALLNPCRTEETISIKERRSK